MPPGHQAEIQPTQEPDVGDLRAQAAALIGDGRMEDAAALLAHGRRLFPDDADLLLDQASLAEATGDQDGAIELLQAAIDRHPGTEAAYLRAGRLCRTLDRAGEAEMVLLEGMCWLPSSADLVGEFARIAEDRGDWGQAARRYRLARERFPSQMWTHVHLAGALRKAKRLSEAERALLDGHAHVPHDAHFLLEHAEIAAEREDWAEAARRFAAARGRFPDAWWACKRNADVLRRDGRAEEAEAVLLDGQQRFPGEVALPIDHAEVAFERRDWAEALSRYEAVRGRYPGDWWPYKRTADALLATGRTDEAEAVLLDGQHRCPGEAALFLEHAEIAAAARNWPEALRRFEIVRDRFPDMWWPLRRISETYRAMDRFDDVERVMLEGMERFPDEATLFFDHADLLRFLSRLDEALERSRFIHQRFRGYWSYFLLARCFDAMGRLEEAEGMLIETIRAFPDERGALVELAFLTGRIPAGVRQLPIATLDEMVAGWIERVGEAEDLLLARAQLAQVAGDYQGYMRRLLHLARVHPGARFVDEKIAGLREVLLGRGEAVPDELGGLDGSPRDADHPSAAHRALLARFESLGGGGSDGVTLYGCEYGFVQRHVGLEPLSLLRWTGVSLENATRLLANDLAGIGEPGTCTLNSVEGYYDWHFVDTAYGLHCDHTHLDRLTVPRDEALGMMCQRFKFLARKLREDLEDGEKVFVYRYLGPAPDEAEVLALAEAVNGHGRNMLLFVCRADADHPPLTVRLVHPGLMIGHIDWFAPDRLSYPVNLDGWMRLCEDADRIWRSQAAG